MDKKLCDLSDIKDNSSAGFVVDTHDGRCGLMVIRKGGMAYSYVNSCPHIGTPLEIQPDRFLDQSGKHILCSTHGALFQVEDGLCIAGPCIDDKLTPVAIDIRGNGVYVNAQELPTIWPPRAAPPKLDV